MGEPDAKKESGKLALTFGTQLAKSESILDAICDPKRASASEMHFEAYVRHRVVELGRELSRVLGEPLTLRWASAAMSYARKLVGVHADIERKQFPVVAVATFNLALSHELSYIIYDHKGFRDTAVNYSNIEMETRATFARHLGVSVAAVSKCQVGVLKSVDYASPRVALAEFLEDFLTNQ